MDACTVLQEKVRDVKEVVSSGCNVATLKRKIDELEREVNKLSHKLDDLERARRKFKKMVQAAMFDKGLSRDERPFPEAYYFSDASLDDDDERTVSDCGDTSDDVDDVDL